MSLTGEYATGTASVTNGDTTVTLVGGITTSLVAGDPFYAANSVGLIDSITDDTHFELKLPWAGTTVSGGVYVVPYLSTQRYQNAFNGQKVRELLTLLDGIGVIYYVPSSSSVPDPANGNDGDVALKITPGSAFLWWVKISGVWVSQGSAIGVAWQGIWDSGETYSPNDIVTRFGVVYIALLETDGDAPESSPTQWQVLITSGNIFPVIWSDSDQPASGETILKSKFGVEVTFPAGMTASNAFSDVAATASAVFSLKKNGVEFATYTFGAGQTVGVFSCPSDTTFSPTDIYSEVAPAPRDATLAGVASTKIGYR